MYTYPGSVVNKARVKLIMLRNKSPWIMISDLLY